MDIRKIKRKIRLIHYKEEYMAYSRIRIIECDFNRILYSIGKTSYLFVFSSSKNLPDIINDN